MSVCDLEEQVNPFSCLREGIWSKTKILEGRNRHFYLTWGNELSLSLGFNDPINNNSARKALHQSSKRHNDIWSLRNIPYYVVNCYLNLLKAMYVYV